MSKQAFYDQFRKLVNIRPPAVDEKSLGKYAECKRASEMYMKMRDEFIVSFFGFVQNVKNDVFAVEMRSSRIRQMADKTERVGEFYGTVDGLKILIFSSKNLFYCLLFDVVNCSVYCMFSLCMIYPTSGYCMKFQCKIFLN